MNRAIVRATLVGAWCVLTALPPVPAIAQTRALGAADGGITVVGHAALQAPPDRLRVVVRLFVRGGSSDRLEAAAASIASAMKSAGIADAKVALPVLGTLSSGSALAIVGTIEKPTRESLETTLRATLRAIPAETAAQIGNEYGVQTTMLLDDCTAYDAKLQAAALADARARAARAAAAAGVTLGSITSINESGAFSASGCVSAPLTAGSAPIVFGPANGEDPYGAVAVQLTLNATVTFAIR